MSWVTTIPVTPSFSRARTMSWLMTAEVTGSSPVVGSSYRRYCGRSAIARARPTRLRMPPDSSAGSLSSAPSRSTRASDSWTRSAITRWSSRWRLSPSSRFSRTVIESNSAANWKTKPILDRRAVSPSRSRSFTTAPSTCTSPASGRSRPTTCLRATLFPLPECPMITIVSPSRTSSEKPFRTSFAPKRLYTSLKTITGAPPPRRRPAPGSSPRSGPRPSWSPDPPPRHHRGC